MPNDSQKIVDLFRIKELQRAIEALREAQRTEFTFYRCGLITQYSKELKEIFNRY